MIGDLLAIWQADTAFPSGAFAFSNGLEGLAALERGLPADRLEVVIEGALRRRWATADRVALLGAYARAGDMDAVAVIDREVEATTLCEAFRTGSRRNGAGLLAAHARIGTPGAAALQALVRSGDTPGHLAVAQGVVWRGAGLERDGAVLASGYIVASGFATAAVRLGLVGAVAAQAVVRRLLPVVAELAATDPPERIESFAPLLDIAAARHARGELRLFSN
ncbi:urease accessory protein UreF 1 [Methylopila jiangsuensis]|uniref:Urease accessory protein UreF n=1 Tax=Methylopila jiangsuensis TaxID=586230 RepID=A0A9W6N2H6_9HYPH|nr:urease accessory UreF family protein [Methylopila jiangsuensis]MDR6287462.1 urease accessory protein [Methylopila jiangsuensis]GLK75042.1 urease accessory protein UreF 1 [Methylopila jiangsuensis]